MKYTRKEKTGPERSPVQGWHVVLWSASPKDYITSCCSLHLHKKHKSHLNIFMLIPQNISSNHCPSTSYAVVDFKNLKQFVWILGILLSLHGDIWGGWEKECHVGSPNSTLDSTKVVTRVFRKVDNMNGLLDYLSICGFSQASAACFCFAKAIKLLFPRAK